MDCGVSYPYYVMDFDHRDPAKKKDGVATLVKKGNVKRLLEEIDKCDVVCSNCHRERTHAPQVLK
jgi:L-lysine 2,3-aminomutase